MKTFLKYYLPLILWALVIFLFSAIPNLKSGLVDVYDIILRKAAHILEFAILAALLLRAVLRKEERANKKVIFLGAIIFGLLFAVLDEYHQTFVIGRHGSVTDVFIDSLGVTLGTGVYLSVKKN